MQPNQPLQTNPVPLMQPDEPPKQNSQRWRSVISTLLIIVLAPLVAITLTTFVFQSYEVDGQSMAHTLEDKDRLIVLKVPRTWARITKHDYIPNRGDVVIFSKAGLYEPGTTQEKQLVKRVIALPGERVVVRDGIIKVYNEANPNGFEPDATLGYKGAIETTPLAYDGVVPDGQVFVCGDNRANSLDSRTFGPIPADDIVGKLLVRILPISKAKAF